MIKTLEEAILHAEEVASDYEDMIEDYYYDSEKLAKCANEQRQLAELLKELAERRKLPEFICCGECGHSMYDEDGELYCDNPNTDVYYTHYDFACNRSERRTDD